MSNVFTLPTTDPEHLMKQAAELDDLAAKKEALASQEWVTPAGAQTLRTDAGYFRSEAASKRAEAERLRKAQVTP